MQRPRMALTLLAALAVVSLWTPAQGATVQQLNLEQMCERAGRIFRGTVLSVREGKVQAGGGELPTVTYRLRVDEAFKGSFETVKDMQIADVTMLGKLKPAATSAARSLSAIAELPRLEVGRDYLLLTTPPSAIGLSTTVGLGQGTFRVTGKGGTETALNLANNLGLLHGMDGSGVTTSEPGAESGPLPYSFVAGLIRDLVGSR